MYYLLEFSKTASKEIHETLDFGLKDEEIQRKYKTIITKQSENVYDLIEKGDLIEFQYHDTKTYDIAKVVHIDEYGIATRGYIHCEEKIRAIYKKDFKGNYILVWNKECEEG